MVNLRCDRLIVALTGSLLSQQTASIPNRREFIKTSKNEQAHVDWWPIDPRNNVITGIKRNFLPRRHTFTVGWDVLAAFL